MNYTQTPNAIYEAMPEMSECELKVTLALVRLTFGYHRDEVKATYAELQAATGLSKQGVADGLNAVKERGFFAPGQGRSVWRTVRNSDQKSQNSRPNEESGAEEESEILTETVRNSDQKSQNSRPSTPVPKERNERKEKENNTDTVVDVGVSQAAHVYENEIGTMSPMISQQLVGAVDEFGSQYVIDAIRIAAENNRRKWSYVNGILENWRREGRHRSRASPNGTASSEEGFELEGSVDGYGGTY